VRITPDLPTESLSKFMPVYLTLALVCQG